MSLFTQQQNLVQTPQDPVAYADEPNTANSFFGNTATDYRYLSYQEELWQKCIEEALRATAEADRAQAEADRAANEADRATTEADRATTEADRAQAEADRAQAEADRAKEEADRAEDAVQATTFRELIDTPIDYIDDAGKFLLVNALEDAVEYVDVIDLGAY